MSHPSRHCKSSVAFRFRRPIPSVNPRAAAVAFRVPDVSPRSRTAAEHPDVVRRNRPSRALALGVTGSLLRVADPRASPEFVLAFPPLNRNGRLAFSSKCLQSFRPCASTYGCAEGLERVRGQPRWAIGRARHLDGPAFEQTDHSTGRSPAIILATSTSLLAPGAIQFWPETPSVLLSRLASTWSV